MPPNFFLAPRPPRGILFQWMLPSTCPRSFERALKGLSERRVETGRFRVSQHGQTLITSRNEVQFSQNDSAPLPGLSRSFSNSFGGSEGLCRVARALARTLRSYESTEKAVSSLRPNSFTVKPYALTKSLSGDTPSRVEVFYKLLTPCNGSSVAHQPSRIATLHQISQ